VTVVGDLLCLFGAVAVIGYLQAGAELRKWMPIFIYALPVTGTAAALLTLLSLAADKASLFAAGRGGAFGYFASRYWAWVAYLALVPGLIGHTGLNTLLRFFPPLVISMSISLEAVFGSIIGYALGLAKIPGCLTWLGGSIMVGALVYNTYCESARQAARSKKAAVSQATAEALADQETVEMAAFTIADEADGDDFMLDRA
jgi:drug/metabolite transporter (DMT)-like permease